MLKVLFESTRHRIKDLAKFQKKEKRFKQRTFKISPQMVTRILLKREREHHFVTLCDDDPAKGFGALYKLQSIHCEHNRSTDKKRRIVLNERGREYWLAESLAIWLVR